MKEIWIIGGGKFGEKAGLTLKDKYPNTAITVIEKNIKTCKRLQMIFEQVICADGIDFLKEHLTVVNAPRWIVPAIPVHVVFCWVSEKLTSDFGLELVALPDEMLTGLPHPLKGMNHDVYVSIADFICPEDCPEPEAFCTKTKKQRMFNLYEKIEDQCPEGYLSVVIRSRQLAPGVGGISPRDLFEGLEKIGSTQKPVIISTACKCHGVLSGFKKSQNGGNKK